MIVNVAVVNELVKTNTNLTVEHLIETELKRWFEIYRMFVHFCNQYMLGTCKCLEKAFCCDCFMIWLIIIWLSVERKNLNVQELKITFHSQNVHFVEIHTIDSAQRVRTKQGYYHHLNKILFIIHYVTLYSIW